MADTGTLSSLLDRLAAARVVCVGDVMLDRFVEGAVGRISPEAPIPVLKIENETEMLGGAGNVARNIAAFGAEALLVSVIGTDEAGTWVRDLVDKTRGITGCLIEDATRPTTIKTRFVAAGQQLLRSDRETVATVSEAIAEEIAGSVEQALHGGGAVLVLSDYGKGVLSPGLIERLILLAEVHSATVIADPIGNDYGRYRGADIVAPNRNELAAASGMATASDDEVIAAARSVIAADGIATVLATRSEQGMSLVDADSVLHLPARARAVFDVSGAGDTVVAAMAAGISAGADAATAAALANAAAGVVVGKVGTAVAYPDEILARLHETELLGADAKVVTLEGARDRVAQWRRQSLRCGFTNGCFDLLHPGHVSLLQQAKNACDRLVVGLNSDSSVRGLKGPERPVQNESSRAQVLASLAAVDLVVVFAEETPLQLIEALRPDLLVKGADYALDQVVGRDLVESWGGAVLLADILDGHSTTGTIAKLSTG